MTATTLANEPIRLLAQSDVLLLVRDVLVAPITARGQLTALADAAELRDLFNLAGLVNASEHVDALLPLWNQSVADGGQSLRQAHGDLFEGSAPCPINETAYVRRDKGAILADIAGFYHAFGFEGGQLGEKLDHMAVELEFASVLLIMRAQAMSDGHTEHAHVAASALESFTRDHIGEWVLPFCDRLAATSALPLHEACAALLGDTWRTIADAEHLTSADNINPRNMTEDPQGPYECGMAEQPIDLTANGLPLPETGTHQEHDPT